MITFCDQDEDIVELTLAQLHIFAAVADAGSLRAAARRLSIAQSGITQQLRKLEANVGGPLFERDVRGVRLTPVGERLRPRAELILGECGKAQEEMRQLRGEATGSVALGLAAEAATRLFPALLASFRERCPRIDVHLTSATSRVLTSWVREGSLDFALAAVAPDADLHDMDTTRLFDSDVVVMARRGHPLARSAALADLRDAQWVSTRTSTKAGTRHRQQSGNKLLALFERAGLPPPRIAATTEAVFDTLHCVAASDYLALEPASLATHPFFREHVAVVPIAERAASTPVCLLRRAGVPLTPAAQELATMAVSFARMLPLPANAASARSVT